LRPTICVLVYLNTVTSGFSQLFNGFAPVQIPTPPASQGIVQSPCTVSGVGVLGSCSQIESVTIDINHTWVGDVAILLVAPNGTIIDLTSQNGNTGDNWNFCTFSDNPANPFITSGSAPYSNTWRPEGRANSINAPYQNSNPLGTYTFANTFNGVNANGTWNLYINDLVGGDIGVVNSWSINFTNLVPPAFPASMTACSQNGTIFGIFDLTTLIPTINGNSGLPVTFYLDAGLTQQVVTTSAFNSFSRTIYAVVGSGACASAPVPITLTVGPLTFATPPTVTLTPTSGCGPTVTGFLFDANLPGNSQGNYTLNYTISPGGTFTVTTNGPSILIFIVMNTNTTVTVNWVQPAGSTCNYTIPPLSVSYTSGSGAPINISGPNTICSGGSINLANITSSTSPITYHSGTPATPANQLPSTVVSPTTTTIYFASTGSGACSNTVPVPINVTTSTITANPASINLCYMGLPTASYNLNSVIPTINNTSGVTVTFYSDVALTQQITNPGAYSSSATTVYAVASNGSCSSAAAPVTLTLDPLPLTGTPSVTITPGSGCVPVTGSILLNVGQPGVFTINYGVNLAPSQSINTLPNGTITVPFVFTESAVVLIYSITNPITSCYYFTQPTSDVFNAITTAPTIAITGNNTICPGASIDLASITSSASPITYHSGNPATAANQLSSTTVSPTVTTIYYASAGSGGCVNTIPVPINVSGGSAPTGNPASINVCDVGSPIGIFNLTSLIPAINGSAGVNITFYTTPGLTTQITNPGAYSSIATTVWAIVSNGTCSSAPIPITLGILSPTLTGVPSLTLSPSSGCTPVLSTLQFNVGQAGNFTINYTVSPGGTQTVNTLANGTASTTVSFNSNATVTINWIRDVGSTCNYTIPPVSATFTSTAAPTITLLGNTTICAGASVNLATITSSTGPLTFHSASPVNAGNQLASSIVSPTTTTLFYASTVSGACVSTILVPINVTPSGTPNIQDAIVCLTNSNFNLNTLLDPAFPTGTWSGLGVTGSTFSAVGQVANVVVTFTPTGCGLPALATLLLGTPTTPNLGTASVCAGGSSFNLNTIADPLASTGVWSGNGVSGTNFNPAGQNGNVTLTFTPSGGCGSPATTTVTVTPSTTPNVSNGTACFGAAPLNLATLQDPLFPVGVWSGTGVTGTTFTPPSSGNFTLTFTPAAACALPDQALITVNGPVTPFLALGNICQGAGTLNLTTLVDPVFPIGTWSGTGVSGNLFDPTGLTGNITVNFTSNNTCTNTASTLIQIGTGGTPTLGTLSVCSNQAPVNLNTLADPLYPTGTWSGQGVTGDLFNPSGLNGAISLTFDAGSTCTNTANTNIQVTPALTPTLQPANICANGTALNLNLLRDPAYTSGTWSGTGVSGTTFTAGTSGIYPVTFTSTQQCIQPATTNITVNALQVPQLGTTTLCAGGASYNLTSLVDPTFPGGSWSGQGVSGNLFNPTGLSGGINLTFTPTNPCASIATTTIQISPTGTPVLGTTTLCSGAGAISLSTLQDPNFISGVWSGQGVSGTVFNPIGLNGNITLTFNPTDPCANNATTTVQVSASTTPVLQGTNLCNNAAPLNLIVLTDPNFTNGTWSGQGVSNGVFNPTGLSGNIPLIFTSTQTCVNQANTSIQVNAISTPSLGTVILCQNSTPVNLNPLAPAGGGTWSGTGVSNNFFNPSGIAVGPVPVTFTSNVQCVLPASTVISVQPSLQTSNLSFDCQGTSSSYVVSFNISGGDPSTYSINGQPAGLAYTSAPVPSGNTYNFTVADANGCGPVTLSGDFDCSCATFSGTMVSSGNVLRKCQNDPITAVFNQNQTLDPDDVLVFVLHNSPNATLGTVLATSATPTFTKPASATLNTTYYISSVAATSNGTGGFQTTDPCLSVSQGVPVSWYALSLTANVSGSVCATNCQNIVTQVVGVDPIRLIYRIQGTTSTQTDTVLLSNGASSFDICPTALNLGSGNYTVTAISISDPNCAEAISTSLGAFTVVQPSSTLNQTLCTGGSLTVGNQTFTQANPTGQVILAGASALGCDSTVQVSLSFAPTANFTFTQQLCVGGSVSIGGQVFNAANPAGQVTLPAASVNGCDSVVTVDLSFVASTLGFVTRTICGSETVTVGSQVFSTTNLTGTVTLPNASFLGCDSIVQVSLSIGQPVVSQFTQQLCTGQTLNIGNQTFTQTNPAGTVTLVGAAASGCDSIVQVSLTFGAEVISTLNRTLCLGQTFTAGGQTFSQTNPIGTVTLTNGSVSGCDSVIQVSLTFSPVQVTEINQTLCNGQTVQAGGQTFSQTNPTGSVTIPNGSFWGCDSIIQVSLTYGPAVVNVANQTLCAGQTFAAGGQTFTQANPTGFVTIPNGSVTGCDSVIQVALSFYPQLIASFNPIICPGQSITIGNRTFNAQTPGGSAIIFNGAYNGCDSVVAVSVVFAQPNSNLVQQLCTGGSLQVGSTVFNAQNPTGQVILPNASTSGCDSTVQVSLTFGSAAINVVNQTLCAGQTFAAGGQTFNQANPTGSITIPNGSFSGCDSVIQVSLTYGTAVVNVVNQTLCAGQTFAVGGQIFSQANPTGSVTIPNGSFSGCDSVIQVSLTYGTAVVNVVNQILCAGQTFAAGGQIFSQANPTGSVTIPNGSFSGCDSVIQVSLTYGTAVVNVVNQTLCAGQTFAVGGQIFSQANPTGSVTIPNGSFSGCDSVIQVALTYRPAVVSTLIQQLCTGSTVVVGSQTFSASNPTGTVVLPNASVTGCDSTVQVNLTFGSQAINTLNPVVCVGETFQVGNQVFSQSNTSGSVLFPNGSYLGCDSVVQVNLAFGQIDTGLITYTFCPNQALNINNQIFDEANPTGYVVFQNASYLGCDSIVRVEISYPNQIVGTLTREICNGASFAFGGKIFNNQNPSGQVILSGASALGCDSTVQVTLSFSPSANFTLAQQLCPDGFVLVGGTRFDAQNPTGLVILENASYQGCDSTVQIALTFGSQVVNVLNQSLCTGEVFAVGGQIFTETNPQGSVTYPNGSVFGCDSVVQVSLAYFPPANGVLRTELCAGDSVTINGKVYNAANPDGTELFEAASLNGCDSTLSIQLQFLDDAVGSIDTFIKFSEKIVINGTTYSSDKTEGIDTLQSMNGCDSILYVRVRIQNDPQVYIPNILGLNTTTPYLTVYGGGDLAEVELLQVFTRWGDEVFRRGAFAPNIAELGWDGKQRDRSVNPGVYVYQTRVRFIDGTVSLFSGDVTVLR
jgi:Proprotein convertase P-domain